MAGVRPAHGMVTGAPLQIDHGDVRLDLQDGLDERVMGGREVEIGTVAALGLEALGEADEHDGQAGLAGDPSALPPAARHSSRSSAP